MTSNVKFWGCFFFAQKSWINELPVSTRRELEHQLLQKKQQGLDRAVLSTWGEAGNGKDGQLDRGRMCFEMELSKIDAASWKGTECLFLHLYFLQCLFYDHNSVVCQLQKHYLYKAKTRRWICNQIGSEIMLELLLTSQIVLRTFCQCGGVWCVELGIVTDLLIQ